VSAASRLAGLVAAEPTYPEVGATRAALLGDDPFGRRGGDRPGLPAGYHHLRYRRRIGRGTSDFHAAAALLHSWRMHRGVGAGVEASGPAVEGTAVLVRLGVVRAPCRVVWSVPVVESDAGGLAGFGYGTLPGHPVRGEEGFVISLTSEGDVWFDLAAFSVGARWYARAAGPVLRAGQSLFARRCATVLSRAAARHT
jgi:uncharacterized protein (UPF0548 family)